MQRTKNGSDALAVMRKHSTFRSDITAPMLLLIISQGWQSYRKKEGFMFARNQNVPLD